MSLPTPAPGLVIRYAYLWRDEAARGREEGVKDRPCVVILAVKREDEHIRVRVAPITHTAPADPAAAVEIPYETGRRLGLDDDRSWIVTTETNVFTWPGPDLRPVDRRTGRFAFGTLAGDTFRRMRDAIISNIRARRAATVERSD